MSIAIDLGGEGSGYRRWSWNRAVPSGWRRLELVLQSMIWSLNSRISSKKIIHNGGEAYAVPADCQ